jgi:DNA-binding beta-propeller fold protein YncE
VAKEATLEPEFLRHVAANTGGPQMRQLSPPAETRRGYWLCRWPLAGLGILLGTLLGVVAAPAAVADESENMLLPNQLITSTVPANGDLNPYGVAIVPANFPTGGAVQPGDVLVSNFNNSNNLQGTGTTIIKFTPSGGHIAPSGEANVFFQGNPGLGLTTALGVLQRGFVLVGSVPTTDGTSKTIKPGALFFLDRNGKMIAPSPFTTMLDGPWDLTIFDQFSSAKVFVSNVLNGTVTRLDLNVGSSMVSVAKATVIATGYTTMPNDSALVLGPTGLAYDPSTDVLYVASTADNEIFAVMHAGKATSPLVRGTIVVRDPHLRGPLGLAFAPNGDLVTANGDAVNTDPAQPSEIVEFAKNGRFVAQFNVDAAPDGAFGLAVGAMSHSLVRFAFVDDVNNTLTVNDEMMGN